MFIYDLSIFLTSTAFVDTNAKYGISLLRYTVFFENYPLGYDPNGLLSFLAPPAGLEQCDNFELPQASLVARISSEILAPVASRSDAQGPW